MAAEESKYMVVITPPVPGQREVGERGFLAHSRDLIPEEGSQELRRLG